MRRSLQEQGVPQVAQVVECVRVAGAAVVLAHDLEYLDAFDQIVFLDDGRVAGDGRHAELVRASDSSQLVDHEGVIEARRGQIVVCLVGDEATCKYYFPEKQHIRLEPANSEMAPILIPRTDWRETSILGVVCGVFRKV